MEHIARLVSPADGGDAALTSATNGARLKRRM